MIAEELLELQEATPFRPFEVHLADGSSFVIKHWKWMMVSPSLRVLHYIQREGPSHQVSIAQITRLVVPEMADGAETAGKR